MQQSTLDSKPSSLDMLFDAWQILARNQYRPPKNSETLYMRVFIRSEHFSETLQADW
jgi:hypothetical protein